MVSLALLPVLGALLVHAPNGWVFNAPNGGWEYPAFLALPVVAQVLIGEGAFALKPVTYLPSSDPRLGCACGSVNLLTLYSAFGGSPARPPNLLVA